MPNEDFKKEVEREPTGPETEPWEIIYGGLTLRSIDGFIHSSLLEPL
jgi:hypothetical protein